MYAHKLFNITNITVQRFKNCVRYLHVTPSSKEKASFLDGSKRI